MTILPPKSKHLMNVVGARCQGNRRCCPVSDSIKIVRNVLHHRCPLEAVMNGRFGSGRLISNRNNYEDVTFICP